MEEIERIAEKLGFRLIYNKDSENDPLYNDMSVAGYDIWVGEFYNEEFELISFFHEYGHHLVGHDTYSKDWEYNTLMIEIECWRRGIEAAKSMGYLFSDSAIQWGYGKAMSYVGHDERECDNWDINFGHKLWVHQERIT